MVTPSSLPRFTATTVSRIATIVPTYMGQWRYWLQSRKMITVKTSSRTESPTELIAGVISPSLTS